MKLHISYLCSSISNIAPDLPLKIYLNTSFRQEYFTSAPVVFFCNNFPRILMVFIDEYSWTCGICSQRFSLLHKDEVYLVVLLANQLAGRKMLSIK